MFATFMIDQLDALMLARIQFAFVISFHIVFPAFSIGLASWLTAVSILVWARRPAGRLMQQKRSSMS